MPNFVICKDFDYLQGHLRYGHAEVTIEAETEEEALTKAEEAFEHYKYNVVVDDFEVEDCGDFCGSAYIK